jgi:hypothetical protein
MQLPPAPTNARQAQGVEATVAAVFQGERQRHHHRGRAKPRLRWRIRTKAAGARTNDGSTVGGVLAVVVVIALTGLFVGGFIHW